MLTLVPPVLLFGFLYSSLFSLQTKLIVFAIYLVLVRVFRYQRRDSIEKIDEKKQFRNIAKNIFLEFPFMFTKSLELALFLTFSVPSISKVLNQSKGFTGSKLNCSYRSEDTYLLVQEFFQNITKEGEFNERALLAIKRTNFIHNLYKNITNNDMLYVLGLFTFPPIDYINKFEYRQLSKKEENAYFETFRQIGLKMGIQHIPETLEEFRVFFFNYRKYNIDYSKDNEEVLKGSIDGYFPKTPKFLLGLIKYLTFSIAPIHDLKAYKEKIRPRWLIIYLHTVFFVRSSFIKYLMFPRPNTYFGMLNCVRVQVTNDVNKRVKPAYDYILGNYKKKEGYTITELGSFQTAAKSGCIMQNLPQYKNAEKPEEKYYDKNVQPWVIP